MSNPRSSNLSLESILVDGTVVPVPPALEGPELETPRGDAGPCRVRAILERVHYHGDNLGSQWEFQIAVDGSVWHSGRIDLPHGTGRQLGVIVSDRSHPGACRSVWPVSVSIRAREFSGWIFPPKLGERVQIVPMPCSPKAFEQHVVTHVSVWRRYRPEIIGWRPRAILVFTLHFTARCETQQ